MDMNAGFGGYVKTDFYCYFSYIVKDNLYDVEILMLVQHLARSFNCFLYIHEIFALQSPFF
jgi:hypothetical protein